MGWEAASLYLSQPTFASPSSGRRAQLRALRRNDASSRASGNDLFATLAAEASRRFANDVVLLILGLPLIGAILMLPYHVTWRSLGPEFLAQFGEEWRVMEPLWGEPEPEEADFVPIDPEEPADPEEPEDPPPPPQ